MPTQANPHPPPPPRGLDAALALVEFLRARCPWDAAQTPASLTRYLLEETHEVVHAIAAGDDAALRDELGDLLLNLAFQVVLAEERQAFSRADVLGGLEEKMRRRHPHLYGGEAEAWEAIKARERAGGPAPTSRLDALPSGLDPLARAQHVQERVARVGFDWPSVDGALEKVREELDEVRRELDEREAEALADEIGDLLFSAVNVARLAGTHAPTALARANAKFERRFRTLERLAAEQQIELGAVPLEELDRLWDDAKRTEVDDPR